MPSQKLADLKAELSSLLSQTDPVIEGLADFARLNLLPNTKAKIMEVTKDFTRRSDLMKAALKALNDLDTDGYPDLSTRIVVKEIFGDLQSNVATLTAAFNKFASTEEAVTATIVPGTPTTISSGPSASQ
jgi:hypothetical protein